MTHKWKRVIAGFLYHHTQGTIRSNFYPNLHICHKCGGPMLFLDHRFYGGNTPGESTGYRLIHVLEDADGACTIIQNITLGARP